MSTLNDFAAVIAEVIRSGEPFALDIADDGLTIHIAVTPIEGGKLMFQISMEGEEASQEALHSLHDWLKEDLAGVPGFDPESIELVSLDDAQ